MKKISFILLAGALAGCNSISSVPYVEPSPSADTAKVRVITNSSVYGDSLTENCIPKIRHKMAVSGRQYESGRMHETYPQFPLQPKTVEGMPKRMAPKMIDLKPGIRMAEGMYVEVATEYLVPTNAPFMISTLGAVMGSYGSTQPTCPMDAKVFDLEAGNSYEVFVGMGPGQTPEGTKLFCALAVRKMLPIGNTGEALPLVVEPKPAPKAKCKS